MLNRKHLADSNIELSLVCGEQGRKLPLLLYSRASKFSPDPFCSLCKTFFKSSVCSGASNYCCDGIYYCAGTTCQTFHWEESHWLLCAATSKSSYLKNLTAYLLPLPERFVIEISCELVASIVSYSVRDSIMEGVDFRNSLRKKFDTFTTLPNLSIGQPVSVGASEVVEESFALLCSLLFNERLSAICQHYGSLLRTETQVALAEVSLTVVSEAVMDLFSLSVWTSIISVVDMFSVPIYLPSPTLLSIHNLPSSVLDYKHRLEYLNLFQKELQGAALYLTGNSLPCPKVFSEHPSTEEQLQVERAIFMLAQAASLQLSNTSIALNNNVTGVIGNPFQHYGTTVHVLVPGLYPGSSIEQSCCPNVMLQPVYDDQGKRWKIVFKTISDIFDDDKYTFDFVKSCDDLTKSLGVFRHLYSTVDSEECPTTASVCHCNECKYKENPINLLCGYSLSLSQDLVILSGSIASKYSHLVKLGGQEVLMRLVSTLASTNKLHMLREVVAVADSLAASKQFSKAAILYSSVLEKVLDGMLDTQMQDVNVSVNPTPQNASMFIQWIAKLCLSLGVSCFEHLLCEDGTAEKATLCVMHAAYKTGNLLVPTDLQLQELATKATVYASSSHDSDRVASRDLQCRKLLDDVYLTLSPEISCEQCDWIIEQAETQAAQTGQNWTTSRHYSVPTTDIPIHRIPNVAAWFTQFMHSTAKLLIHQCYFPLVSWDDLQLVINDAFIVKYDGDAGDGRIKQRSLPLHMDQSTHSFTIALNQVNEYVGGGTYLPQLGDAVRPEKGHMLCFSGNTLHGGDAVLSGKRYIIAAFLAVLVLPTSRKRANSLEEVGPAKKANTVGGSIFSSAKEDGGAKGFTFDFSV